ncbi:nuclear transport factor 2 family protein [Saccharopolyspora sp. TS4A08]|uniref:Nuclear transport factor 2 family protein n=1 Tax=Saccharopolyspora ipomoeae TaxID=3042027 RepID=A0ABT6PQE6_9PSEU|nr:nuclear transport factor 2 family protein [Saccharopolyspora sp. TS4A08]MDI2030227.1 nuclear transport factor 2 family protein [Saccharopolyspora sp. TS4A08]
MTDDLLRRLSRLEALEAIRDLDARYCRALDDGDWDALVSLFTEDGQFVGLSRATGPAELRAFFTGLADSGLTAFWHHVTNLEITLDGEETARARSFLWQPCVQDGVAHIAAGRYVDSLRRVDGSWRYARKQVSFDYFVPLTEGWDHGRFTVASAAATYPGRPFA